jgi:hypothetical protein
MCHARCDNVVTILGSDLPEMTLLAKHRHVVEIAQDALRSLKHLRRRAMMRQGWLMHLIPLIIAVGVLVVVVVWAVFHIPNEDDHGRDKDERLKLRDDIVLDIRGANQYCLGYIALPNRHHCRRPPDRVWACY